VTAQMCACSHPREMHAHRWPKPADCLARVRDPQAKRMVKCPCPDYLPVVSGPRRRPPQTRRRSRKRRAARSILRGLRRLI
jgi:hypothetical protein